MEKKTASDMRAYLSSFQPEYPVKKGYIAHLIVNEKLASGDICRMIKGMVQRAEPDRQIKEGSVKTCVSEIKRHTAKKMNYTMQWADLLKFNQQPFPISFMPGELLGASAATSAPLIQPDHTCAPFVQADHSSAPLIQPDRTCAPFVQADHSSAPLIQPDHTCAPFVQADHSSAPLTQPDHTCAPFVQADHSSAPLTQSDHTCVPHAQTDHAQHTAATPLVEELPSNSNHGESFSISVLTRSPSPKRLKKDCDSCVAKQRTSLNMLKENRHLRLQMRAHRIRHREEKKELIEFWKAKYSNLKRQFKEQEMQHRTHEMLIIKTYEEEKKGVTIKIEN